jgi:thymidylate synthase ThyX
MWSIILKYIPYYNYLYKTKTSKKKMAKVINPKIEVVSYGPELKIKIYDEKEIVVSSDEFVYGAANITYKDIGALRELIDLKKNDVDISNKVRKMLIKVGGSGHASMATTPGFWTFIEGDSSKFVDSIFTTAVFGSSLMPSGRRVPISKEAIVVPKMIINKGNELTNLYLQQSEKNIQLYEILQTKDVPKEEAAKIVQYGHRGGGFMFMPLETLIHFSKLAERNPEDMPEEGKEIISKLEDFVKSHGMEIIYEARKRSPRTGCVHPNIFRDANSSNKNYVEELVDTREKTDPIFYEPHLLSKNIQGSPELNRRLKNYFERRKTVFKNSKLIKNEWENLLGELECIVNDFNTTVNIKIGSNIPWRIWGEVKRHRTLSQDTESIYHAVNRAIEKVHINNNEIGGIDNPNFWYPVVSLPSNVRNNEKNFEMWINEFSNSIKVYQQLINAGIKKSEALAIIPRGIKLMNIKNYDLYNLTTGYISLRLCGTAEFEMRAITEQEAKIVKKIFPYPELISPKCHHVGFCPEIDYQGKKCMKINQQIKNYDEEMHKDLQKTRVKNIEENLFNPNP